MNRLLSRAAGFIVRYDMKKIRIVLIILTCCFLTAAAGEEAVSFPALSYQDTLDWVKEHPSGDINLGKTKWTPVQLAEIRSVMSDQTLLQFQAEFRKAQYQEDTEILNLNGSAKKISRDDLDALIRILPELQEVNVSKHRELSNSVMPELTEQYPDIRWIWQIVLPYSHSLTTAFTAYSTMNNVGKERRIPSEKLEILQYVPEMQALDLGHNRITDLNFLDYMPKMQMLILADNDITDITPIGRLKELRYCEIFMNPITDLSAFGECTELLDLNIVSTRITSLDGLEKCTKLERLWAPREENIDPDSIIRFRESHPDCEITFNKNDCTGRGWRKHWRYRHYIRSFKTHNWIPFEDSDMKPDPS